MLRGVCDRCVAAIARPREDYAALLSEIIAELKAIKSGTLSKHQADHLAVIEDRTVATYKRLDSVAGIKPLLEQATAVLFQIATDEAKHRRGDRALLSQLLNGVHHLAQLLEQGIAIVENGAPAGPATKARKTTAKRKPKKRAK